MTKLVLTALFSLIAVEFSGCTPASAHHAYDLAAPHGALRIIDGDTVVVGKRTVRAVGYDTPEKGHLAKCDREQALAGKATERFKELTAAPHVLTLKWAKGSDKFGRGLAIFYVDHKPVAPMLIAEGLAHPYDGGAKASWCD